MSSRSVLVVFAIAAVVPCALAEQPSDLPDPVGYALKCSYEFSENFVLAWRDASMSLLGITQAIGNRFFRLLSLWRWNQAGEPTKTRKGWKNYEIDTYDGKYGGDYAPLGIFKQAIKLDSNPGDDVPQGVPVDIRLTDNYVLLTDGDTIPFDPTGIEGVESNANDFGELPKGYLKNYEGGSLPYEP